MQLKFEIIWTGIGKVIRLQNDNTLGKDMNPLILPAMGLIVPLLFFYKDGFGIK